MLRKIDRFIGRHMNAWSWVVVWLIVCGGASWLITEGAWMAVGIPLLAVGLFGVAGNIRRLG